jgi:tripartite-type tricarboxylate transporter receptor subunit TctC
MREEIEMKKRMLFTVVLSMILLLISTMDSTAASGKYPERPVDCIVPWGVGASSAFAQALNKPTEKFLGQPLPVINIPGASGCAGLIELMRRPADGYSIITVNTDTVIGSAMGTCQVTVDKLSFIVRGAISHTWICVRKDSPFTKFEEVVQYAKENPGKLKFAGSGMASNEILAVAALAKAGVKMKYVSYDGVEQWLAVLRGEVDMGCSEISQSLHFVESGQLRPLAFAAEKRVRGFPDVPTLKELGFDIVLPMLRGVATKKGVAPSILKILEDAFTKGAETDDWKKFMISKKLDPDEGFMNSQDFEKFIKDDHEFIKKLGKDAILMAK